MLTFERASSVNFLTIFSRVSSVELITLLVFEAIKYAKVSYSFFCIAEATCFNSFLFFESPNALAKSCKASDVSIILITSLLSLITLDIALTLDLDVIILVITADKPGSVIASPSISITMFGKVPKSIPKDSLTRSKSYSSLPELCRPYAFNIFSATFSPFIKLYKEALRASPPCIISIDLPTVYIELSIASAGLENILPAVFLNISLVAYQVE